ncbi:VOC family protein [Paenibacillus glycanilyticus]|uniref:Catechol-2,3-dioxygenase n=1 Tax=Paenibacillus glycanilyticus TaxID=126569 RepID=A0ABQ6GJ51_9BACL|nr:VOC family protein [Paenibacillus glycanilyticus]GLX69363.1 catechol-2,3-dioxygenase [Paenibacillus glycanilyticus]
MSISIHPDTTLGAVKLKISDLTQSLRFYTEVVGLRILEKTDASAALTADGKTALVLLEQIPDAIVAPERRRTTGLYHYALLLPNRKELGIVLKRLIAHRIPLGQADHLVSEALYISDPDNNGIEIYADRPRSEWKRDANGDYEMATDPVDWEGLLQEAGEEPITKGLPPETIMGHVHLHTVGIEESRAFYTGLLGFDVVGDYKQMRALFVSAGGYHHHLGLNIWAGIGAPAPSPRSTGLDYYTIVYPDSGTLSAALERLLAAGIAVDQQDGEAYVTDPSSVRIKLTTKLVHQN